MPDPCEASKHSSASLRRCERQYRPSQSARATSERSAYALQNVSTASVATRKRQPPPRAENPRLSPKTHRPNGDAKREPPEGEPQSLETVGRELGLTRERARQLQVQALKQLETELADLAPVQTATAGAAQAREGERVPA
jgi:hypothetical protein